MPNHLLTVALPDGDKVKISTQPEGWWSTHNASGYVDPAMIAPDPKNPRKYMNHARLAELNESVKARGVRQQLIVTPRHLVPWVTVDPEHEKCFFVAVSGHRRRSAAINANLRAVPVKVAIYAFEKDHRMDMSLLNKGQDDLSPLEEGYEIVELQSLGWKIDDLCKSFGFEAPKLYGRMHLTKLHPSLQQLLDVDVPKGKRIPITLGGALGAVKAPTVEELEELYKTFHAAIPRIEVVPNKDWENLDDDDLRFGLQHILLAVIRQRVLNATRAAEFIKERTLSLQAGRSASGKKTERYQPRRRKDVLETLLKEVAGSVVVDWTPEEFNRIFELSPREEVEAYLKKIGASQNILAKLTQILASIRDKKKPTHPDALKFMRQKVPA